ncbi:L-lactate permease [Proteus mirabilis]|uniref:L-lactate permease n=1 Tax=Proteus mirabilis TaxID=584 RepID=UPI0020369D4C|nr:L-lactate permease [Proteus mirabilis]MCT8244344.1 L-lactate permease [Proteus mirabilis]USA27644.1 L-lactate permease [Proteus mirabilis]WSH39221.1 L-lactate permease [Proteus mirabilis]
MSDYLSFLLGIVPLAVLIFMILKMKSAVHHAVLVSLIITVALAIFHWNNTLQFASVSVLYGAVKGLWPIIIVILAAIYSYNLMLKTGGMEVLKDVLAGISDDKRVQVLLISWCFGGFLEAVAGYGTAVAIPIGILIALGFDPFKAAVASLVANTVPTAFGAVGIPVSILAQNTGLDVLVLSKTIIIQLGLFNILLPFVIVAIAGGGIKAIKGVGFITLMCGISTLIPQYIVAANLGAELPAFAGSLVSLIVVIFLAKRMKTGHDKSKQPTKHSAKELLVASSIYLFTFIFILACSPLFPTIQTAVGAIATKIPFVLSDTQTEYQTIAWLSTPGVLIILASFVGGTIQGASLSTLFSVLVKTTIQLKNSIIAIMAIVAMATVMDFSGMIGSIAETLVNFTGAGFIFIAPVIGALGTFVTGSDTNSNVLFGKLQTSAAAKLHVDPFILAAANTSGATGGKMISPQSIAIAVSATKMDGQSSAIMRETLKYCIAYIIILGAKIGIIYHLMN